MIAYHFCYGNLFHRPDWDRCAQVLEGGEERWNVISQDKKSDELVGILLREISGDGVGFEWFEPRVSQSTVL